MTRRRGPIPDGLLHVPPVHASQFRWRTMPRDELRRDLMAIMRSLAEVMG